MENFGYSKSWKFHKFMSCGYPIIPLLGMLAILLFVVVPSQGEAIRFEFKWWFPLLVLGLLVWAFIEIRKFRRTLKFSVGLSEEGIRVGDDEAKWTDITRIVLKDVAGESSAIVLHTRMGSTMEIPGATASLPYIKGFVEGHAKKPVGE